MLSLLCAERSRERRPPKHKEAGEGLGGRAQRLPPSALAGGLTLYCRCLVLVLVVAAVVVFARSVAVRGGNLKNREAGGGLGGRAQRLPPSALAGGLTLVWL